MIRFAVLFIVAFPLSAFAQDAPDGAGGSLCLSDGQTLTGVRIAQDTAHRTVRIGEGDVRVPNNVIAADCSALKLAPSADPEGLRTVELVDGQRLYGTPMYAPGQVTLALLDESRIHLPDATVHRVERLDRGPDALEPVHQQRARTRTKKMLGIATDVGLGVLGAAAVGGITWGVVAASNNPQE